MIQDIGPRTFHNSFKNRKAEREDLFLSFHEDAVLIREDKDKLWYPSFADYAGDYPDLKENARFLFSIDDIHYYRAGVEVAPVDGWAYVSTSRFRTETKYWRSFAGAVGRQLDQWYENHRYCSRCARDLKHSDTERMLYCEACGFQNYPTISPAVIVAVHDGDRILLTKYKGRAYSNFALIAGFAEIGESLEQTVHREVMEEVGLNVKNLKFYKTQPWPFSNTLLAGFFAELDGDDAIVLQEDELSLGIWMPRDEITEAGSGISLTTEMVEAFRKGEVEL